MQWVGEARVTEDDPPRHQRRAGRCPADPPDQADRYDRAKSSQHLLSGEGGQVKVVHLDDQRTQPDGAALRVPFSSSEVGDLAARHGNALGIVAGYPAATVEADEELAVPRHVRTDLTTRRNVNDGTWASPDPAASSAALASRLAKSTIGASSRGATLKRIIARARTPIARRRNHHRPSPRAPVAEPPTVSVGIWNRARRSSSMSGRRRWRGPGFDPTRGSRVA